MKLPRILDPIKLGKQAGQLNGELRLADCPRLQEIADQGDHYYINGTVNAMINVICQRCNEMMPYIIDISFSLSPVVSDERAKRLPAAYEPVPMQDEVVNVHEMIEEEILLALPMIPKHDQCG
jgi:uncharacterized protein